MSEEKQPEGIVIDVEPEREPESPTHADADAQAAAGEAELAPPVRPDRRAGGSLALILSVLALLIGVALFAAGYWLVGQARNDLAALDRRMADAVARQAELQSSVDKANAEVESQRAELQEQRSSSGAREQALSDVTEAFRKQESLLADEKLRMEEREGELRAAVAEVHRRVGRSGTQWMVAEAEYLIRIANHRLNLARDIETATVALGLADQRLRDTRDPGWNGVREQIARDSARLDATQDVDSAGIAARLNALVEQIPNLRLARTTAGPERTLPGGGTQPRKPEERSWGTLLNDIVSGVKDSVRIRRRDQPVQAMLAPEHLFFLYENLKLHVESARLALARGDVALYQDSLATAGRWLDRHFDGDDQATRKARDLLTGLAGTEIRPELPDISQSLRVMQARQKLMADLAPTGTEGTTGKAE